MKKALLLISLTLLIFSTGCSQMQSAAQVGDSVISLKELQSSVDSILAERTKIDTSQMQLQQGEDLTRSQLNFFISNLIIESIATDEKITVSKADTEAYLTQIYANIGGQNQLPPVLVNAGIAPSNLDSVLRRDLILQKLTDAAKASGADDAAATTKIQILIKSKANSLKITVNPRYGKWDGDQLSVVSAEPAGSAVTTK